MKGLIQTFVRDREGTTAIFYALAFVALVGVAGLAVDFSLGVNAGTRLQAAVDSAAMAGARAPGGSDVSRVAAAESVFKSNVDNWLIKTAQPRITAKDGQVTASASVDVPTVLMKALGHSKITINATASAQSGVSSGGKGCIIALSRTSPDGLHLQGNNELTAENCWVWVNSKHSTSINAVGTSSGSAAGFCTAGSVSGPEHFTPKPRGPCKTLDDPYYSSFESSKVTSKSHCTHTNLTLKSGTHKFGGDTTFCRDTVFKPHAHIELDPGTYYFVDGYLEVQAGSSVTCPVCKDQAGKGVTLVFLGDDTRMIVRGGADVELKAPAAGDLAGFVIVDHKLQSDNSIRETIIRGGGNVQIEGMIYTPQWQITISGNSAINQQAKYTAVIADSFYMEGNAEFHVKAEATAAGLPDLMPEVKTVPAFIN